MMKISQPAAQAAFALALLLLPLAAIPSASEAQAVPTAEVAPVSTGFALPSVAGSLQYALSASESVSSDSYGTPGVVPSTYLTGDLAFITGSQRDPFSMVFSGGHSWANSYQPSFTFFNLALSQTASVGRWAIVLADAVSYMPGTPSTGLSGIPGVGDLGATPLPAGANPGATGINPLPVPTSSGQGVLTGFSTQVDNTSSLSVQRQITGKTSLIASGSYFLMRFLGDTGGSTASITPGLDSDGDAASLGLNHRIDARTSVGGNYAYTRNTYSGYDFGTPMPAFSTQTASLLYTYQFTRKLATNLSAGPQWISIATPGNTPSLSLFANLSVIHREVLVGVQIELLDDGLNAGAALDLLVDGGQPGVDVLGDDGGDEAAGDLLLVDLYGGLRDVLRGDVERGGDGEDRQHERWDQDDPPATLEDGEIIFGVQCAMAKHGCSFPYGCPMRTAAGE